MMTALNGFTAWYDKPQTIVLATRSGLQKLCADRFTKDGWPTIVCKGELWSIHWTSVGAGMFRVYLSKGVVT